jgi:hypothetical protein
MLIALLSPCPLTLLSVWRSTDDGLNWRLITNQARQSSRQQRAAASTHHTLMQRRSSSTASYRLLVMSDVSCCGVRRALRCCCSAWIGRWETLVLSTRMPLRADGDILYVIGGGYDQNKADALNDVVSTTTQSRKQQRDVDSSQCTALSCSAIISRPISPLHRAAVGVVRQRRDVDCTLQCRSMAWTVGPRWRRDVRRHHRLLWWHCA